MSCLEEGESGFYQREVRVGNIRVCWLVYEDVLLGGRFLWSQFPFVGVFIIVGPTGDSFYLV